MSPLDRLKNEVFPEAVKLGKFGDDVEQFINFKIDEGHKCEDQYASTAIFGEVLLESKNKIIKSFGVVIKVQQLHSIECNVQNSFDHQFYNEYLFYSEVLPLLKEVDSQGILDKCFPKFFYGLATKGEDPRRDVLIFENLNEKGFISTESRTFLDYDHVRLAFERIAEFHSLSLKSRRKSPKTFKDVAEKILDARWTEFENRVDTEAFLSANCRRGILPLEADPKYKEKIKEILPLLKTTNLLLNKLVVPAEPLAVICHGDFGRNNMFFKYGSDGKPCAVKFFDLANICYASPIIDLSLFLFLNTSPELKADHWENILQVYLSAFNSDPELNVEDSLSIEDVRQDFRRRGFYGYIHTSYFLPMISVEDKEDWDSWKKIPVEEKIALRLQTGGELVTNYLAQLVKHMIDKEFDFKYLANVIDQSVSA